MTGPGFSCADGAQVVELLRSLDWTEVDAGSARFGTCKYFRAYLPAEYVGWEGVRLLSELSPELAEVRVAVGRHGNLELRLPGMKPVSTQEIHLILGADTPEFPNGAVSEETVTVVTWYSGRLLAPVDLRAAIVKAV